MILLPIRFVGNRNRRHLDICAVVEYNECRRLPVLIVSAIIPLHFIFNPAMSRSVEHDYLAVNRASWNWRTGQHFHSRFYDVESFLAGKNSLNEIEMNLLGDVRDKTVLHLQCHFGQDTLSLARLGAKIFGVDLSDEAIRKAGELNAKLGLDAGFLCSDVYDLPNRLDQKFDIVFTSYGVLGWLPDMNRWASVVGHFLKPGGVFVMVEFHPVVWMFDEHFTKIEYAYDSPEPFIETVGTYTDTTDASQFTTVSWNHGLGNVVTSLIRHGVTIDRLTEYDYSPYDIFPDAVESEPGKFRILDGKIPLTYSIKGYKQ